MNSDWFPLLFRESGVGKGVKESGVEGGVGRVRTGGEAARFLSSDLNLNRIQFTCSL